MDDKRYDKAYNALNRKECTSGKISHHVIPMVANSDSAKYVSKYQAAAIDNHLVTDSMKAEHIMELQTMVLFLGDIANHELPDDSAPTSP